MSSSKKAGPGGPAAPNDAEATRGYLNASLLQIDHGLAAFKTFTLRDQEPIEHDLAQVAAQCEGLADELRAKISKKPPERWLAQALGFLVGAVDHLRYFIDNAPPWMDDATQFRLGREHGPGFVHVQLIGIKEDRRAFAATSIAAASAIYGRAQGVAQAALERTQTAKKAQKSSAAARAKLPAADVLRRELQEKIDNGTESATAKAWLARRYGVTSQGLGQKLKRNVKPG